MCFHIQPATSQDWVFEGTTLEAYQLALDLHIEEALALIGKPETAAEAYVVSFAHAMDLLVTEDPEKLPVYERWMEELPDLKFRRASAADYSFLLAETHLQWAFIYLKFGHELDAAAQLRKAYVIASDCRREFADFRPIRKTYGLLQVIVGAVPEKYNWVMSLLGMKGEIDAGLRDLADAARNGATFHLEASLLRALTYGFVMQEPDSAIRITDEMLSRFPRQRLALYIAATIAMKNAMSPRALSWLKTLTDSVSGPPIPYVHYLSGEVYLHKGDYLAALASYRWFVNHYRGENYIKDAYYKMGLCYLLSGSPNDAEMMFREAKENGRESAEADRHASMSLLQRERPNIQLTRARYSMDGGYYHEAGAILGSLRDEDLPSKRDQVEYFYRKARLAHLTGDLKAAKLFYEQTIDLAGNESWYFAPNSCLQMGYILMTSDPEKARRLFRRALTYKKHEYKNSIDSKARSALSRMKD